MKKILLIVGIVALVSLLAVCAGCTSSQSLNGQVAKSGDTVNVYYTMYVDGEEYQTNVGSTPFTFVIDGGNVISGFNSAVLGMKVGETKKVSIPPAEGYGEKTQITQKLSEMESAAQQTLEVGNSLYLSTGTGIFSADIVSIDRNADSVVLDIYNAGAPKDLVGKTLDYEITLDSIKSA